MKKVQKNKQFDVKPFDIDGSKKTKLKPIPKDKYKSPKKFIDDDDDQLDDFLSFKDDYEE